MKHFFIIKEEYRKQTDVKNRIICTLFHLQNINKEDLLYKYRIIDAFTIGSKVRIKNTTRNWLVDMEQFENKTVIIENISFIQHWFDITTSVYKFLIYDIQEVIQY